MNGYHCLNCGEKLKQLSVNQIPINTNAQSVVQHGIG